MIDNREELIASAIVGICIASMAFLAAFLLLRSVGVIGPNICIVGCV